MATAASHSSSSKGGATTAKPQWREAVSGACAGAVSRTILAPVERIKLLKQLATTSSTTTSTTSTTTKTAAAAAKFALSPNASAWEVAKTVYRTQGLASFWRGNVPNVLRVSGTAAINFTCMDYYKRAAVAPLLQYYFSSSSQRQQRFVTSLVSGGLAGATATTVLYPVEFVRTRLAMDLGSGGQRQYRGMTDVVRSIWRSDGVLGFFQGYGIALTGGVVYRILLLGGYDALKEELLFRKHQNQQQLDNDTNVLTGTTASPNINNQQLVLSWGERFASAQFISLTAGTISYPFDSVRRRLMMQAGQPVSSRKYRNALHCIRSVWSTEGLRGFFLGLGPNIVRSVGGALLLVSYDRIRTLL